MILFSSCDSYFVCFFIFFFFQAEDGIRDHCVTGVQTCALPILWYPRRAAFRAGSVAGTQWDDANVGDYSVALGQNTIASARSEERRVGKECRSRGGTEQEKKKEKNDV